MTIRRSETEQQKLEGLIVSSAATAEFVANELEELTKDALIDGDVIHLQIKRLRGQQLVLMKVADALKECLGYWKTRLGQPLVCRLSGLDRSSWCANCQQFDVREKALTP